MTFDIRPGITGLLGPNGAGKTTLLRMITGLAEVSDGSITVFGESVRNNSDLYRRIGVMSEHETVYQFMKGREFVKMMARLKGVADIDMAADRAIGLVDLADASLRPMGTYSRGMRQRMRLAATLVHEPEILILDEPLNGADPRQRVYFQSLLKRLAAEGRTIVISSHILEEVERTQSGAEPRAIIRFPRDQGGAGRAAVPREAAERFAARTRFCAGEARIGRRGEYRPRWRAGGAEPERARPAD